MRRLCLIGGLVLAVGTAGCGSAAQPRGVAPIGRGTQYRPASLAQKVAAARPVRPGLECGRAAAAHWAHVELLARGKVMILPAGVGAGLTLGDLFAIDPHASYRFPTGR